jgi:predicted ATPase
LIVLDNVEHLVADAAAHIAGLLESLPHLRIVATSQVPLRVGAECVLAFDAPHDSAALQRYGKHRPRRALRV